MRIQVCRSEKEGKVLDETPIIAVADKTLYLKINIVFTMHTTSRQDGKLSYYYLIIYFDIKFNAKNYWYVARVCMH